MKGGESVRAPHDAISWLVTAIIVIILVFVLIRLLDVIL